MTIKTHKPGIAKVADLIPYARNPRTHSPEQVNKIAASIKEFGFTNPVLIDETGMIIAGHGRVQAANKLGLKEVPIVTLSDLTDAQKKALVIADNRLAEDAGWDDALLSGILHDLNAEDFDLSLTGFDADELDDLLRPMSDDDLSDKESDASGSDTQRLVCGDFSVPVNDGELQRLQAKLDSYVNQSGAPYGFVAWLLDGAN